MKKLAMLALATAFPMAGFGKAAFYGKNEMIRQSEIIAVVTVTKVEPTKVKGKGWTYGEAATIEVEKVLKGTLPAAVTLYGKENFICAQVRYQPGRHIVFLRHDQDLLTGVNWHLGVRPIKENQVEWFANDKSLELKPTPLNEVLTEINNALKKQ